MYDWYSYEGAASGRVAEGVASLPNACVEERHGGEGGDGPGTGGAVCSVVRTGCGNTAWHCLAHPEREKKKADSELVNIRSET